MQYVSSAIGVTILVYVALIAIADSPINKIDRVCDPAFIWPKKAIVAMAKMGSPNSVPGIEKSFNSGHGRCRAWMWDTFFEEEYRKMQADVEAAKKATEDAKRGAR
jgi:hypothetical protein